MTTFTVQFGSKPTMPPDDRILVFVRPGDLFVERPCLDGGLHAVWLVLPKLGIKGLFQPRFAKVVYTDIQRRMAERWALEYLSQHPGSAGYTGKLAVKATLDHPPVYKLYSLNA